MNVGGEKLWIGKRFFKSIEQLVWRQLWAIEVIGYDDVDSVIELTSLRIKLEGERENQLVENVKSQLLFTVLRHTSLSSYISWEAASLRNS